MGGTPTPHKTLRQFVYTGAGQDGTEPFFRGEGVPPSHHSIARNVFPDPPESYDADCWCGLQMFAAMLFTKPTKANAQPPIAKYMNTPGIAEITGADVVSARR